MRSLRRAARVENASGHYRFERAFAVFAGRKASKTAKSAIARVVTRIVRMIVRPARIGLPEFDHCIIHRLAVAIQYAANQRYALSAAAGAAQAPEGRIGRKTKMEERADGLRRRRVQNTHNGTPRWRVFFSRGFRGVRCAHVNLQTVSRDGRAA